MSRASLAAAPAVRTNAAAPARPSPGNGAPHARPAATSPQALLQMQRHLGNRFVGRMLGQVDRCACEGEDARDRCAVPATGPARAVQREKAEGVPVQRYSLGELGDDISSVGDAAASGIRQAGSTVADGIDAAGNALSSAAHSVGDALGDGLHDVASGADGAMHAAGNAASGVVDWIKSEAGQLALRAANALAAKFGGKVVVSPAGGIDILIADVRAAEVEDETFVLPIGLPTQPVFDAPFKVGTFVINTYVGSVIGDPSVTAAVGPVDLRNVRLHLDPGGGRYAGTAQLYIGSELVGTGESSTEARVQAAGVIPFDPPIPIEASAAVGVRDILRLAAKEGVTDTVEIGYSDGRWGLNNLLDVKLGALAHIEREAFLRVEIEGRQVCSVIWPITSHRLRAGGIEIGLPVSVSGGGGDGVSVKAGKPTTGRIPPDAIISSLNNDKPPSNCMSVKELIGFLCKSGKLPKDACAVLPAGPGANGPGALGIPGAVPGFGPGRGGSPPGGTAPTRNCAGPPTGPCPHDAPASVALLLPALKGADVDVYEARLRRGQLQHRVGRDRETNQRTFWMGVMPNRIPATVAKDGADRGLTRRDLAMPYWSRSRVLGSRGFQVDHVLEMQVAPLDNPGQFDVLSNMRLMESSQNGSCGPEMSAAICNMRGALAAMDGEGWLTCDLTFDTVLTRGTAQREIWTQQELIDGEQIRAFDRLGRPPRP